MHFVYFFLDFRRCFTTTNVWKTEPVIEPKFLKKGELIVELLKFGCSIDQFYLSNLALDVC